MFRPTLFTLLALLLTAVAAQIRFDKGDADKIDVVSFGDYSTSVSVLYKGPEVPAEDVIISETDIFTVGEILREDGSDEFEGYFNYTYALEFNKDVGRRNYTVTIGELTIEGFCTAAGFVIKQDGVIVSGEGNDGISVGQDGTTTYQVNAVGTDGNPIAISDTVLTFRESTGPYMKEVDEGKTSINSDTFTLALNQYRIGTGQFEILFETEQIEYFGEIFETILRVTQSTSPIPPCVAVAGDYESTNGFVRINMFNLLIPPRSENVSTVSLTVGTETAEWNTGSSTLGLPDQVAAFQISSSGKGSLKCDDEDAVIIGGDIDVTGDGSDGLATSLIESLPSSDTEATIEASIRILDTSVATYTRIEGQEFKDEFCALLVQQVDACAITGLEDGSVIVDMKALVDPDDAEENNERIKKAFLPPDCPFQTNQGRPCSDMELLENRVIAASGSVGAGAGLATWTIVLIAVVGAFAVILVIVLTLWAVYRRSSENSESEYSSSGPLGVPDPSDLLYEQSIVRDIYGRGDFPDGGPSPAVAEQRAREADLREEFPRPPSSSGLSRGGAATDDASSTYSV